MGIDKEKFWKGLQVKASSYENPLEQLAFVEGMLYTIKELLPDEITEEVDSMLSQWETMANAIRTMMKFKIE